MPTLRIWKSHTGTGWAWSCDEGDCATGHTPNQADAIVEANLHQAAHLADAVHVEEDE